MTKSLAALTAAALAIGGFALAAPVAAQEPEPFVIEFDRGNSFLPTLGVIRAFMGVTECGSLDGTQPDWTIVIGGPDAPEACNQPWRVINLIPERNGLIAEAPIFRPGGTTKLDVITLFAFFDDSSDEPFFIRAGDNVTATDIAALGSLTAYVGGVGCGSASLADLEAGILHIPVGAPSTPDACRETGSEIRLVNPVDGSTLAVRLSVRPGFYILDDLTLEPAGPGVPLPNAAGNMGLVASEDAPSPLAPWLLALAGALLAGGRYLTRERFVQSRLR